MLETEGFHTFTTSICFRLLARMYTDKVHLGVVNAGIHHDPSIFGDRHCQSTQLDMGGGFRVSLERFRGDQKAKSTFAGVEGLLVAARNP